MADRLIIQDLAASCRIGVTEQERVAAQPIWIDLELGINAAKAAARDDVRDAVDYARLVAEVKRVAEGRTYALLETLAEAVASRVLAGCGTSLVRVRVKKRALPEVDYAAVDVERSVRRARAGRPSARRRRRTPAAGR